jgi:hypothetical protein
MSGARTQEDPAPETVVTVTPATLAFPVSDTVSDTGSIPSD